MPTLVNGTAINYSTVPVPYMADGLKLYIENGIAPGGFMLAVLSNDLVGACMRADDTNRRYIFEWVSWLCQHFPSQAWGSPERVKAWMTERQSSVSAECE